MTAEGEDKIIDAGLSIICIAIHICLLRCRIFGVRRRKTLHLFYQIYTCNSAFSQYLWGFSGAELSVQQTLSMIICKLKKWDLVIWYTVYVKPLQEMLRELSIAVWMIVMSSQKISNLSRTY